MDTMDCTECGRLRDAYRRATRKQLELMVMFDQAVMGNDQARLAELRMLLAGATVVRMNASQNILDHESRPHDSLSSSPVQSEAATSG